MYRHLNIVRAAGVIFSGLLITLQTGCSQSAEIPITTISEEARAVFLEGRQLAENIRFDEAKALLDQVIEKDPEFALAHFYRAWTAGPGKDRRDHIGHAMAMAPDVSRGERLLIESFHAVWMENDPVKALDLRKRLVRRYPKDKRAHWLLGFSYGVQNEFDKAIAEYEKAIEIDQAFAPAYNNLGYANILKGEYAQSEDAFKNYIRLIPDEANPYDSMADLLTRMGRHEEAIEHYQKAAELNPTFGFSQRKVGLSQIYLGQYDEGRKSIRQAIEMEPIPFGKVLDLEAIAFSYLFEGQPQRALAEIGKAMELAAEAKLPARLARIHSGMCYLQAELGNLAEAEQSLAACREVVAGAELTPAVVDDLADQVLFHEAFIAAKRQDFQTALAKADELKASIEAGADPEEIEGYYLLLGMIYLEQGEYTQALEQLAELDQDDPFYVYQLAQGEAGMGNQDKATELYQKVASWNEVQSQSTNDLMRAMTYALVRPKALAAIGE